jgi:hypothetical protein
MQSHSIENQKSNQYYAQLLEILNRTRYGAPRREALLGLLAKAEWYGCRPEFPVNRKHCVVVDQDPDLQLLLKRGVLQRKRIHQSSVSGITYLFMHRGD